jgi:UDP-hydrolysing UDP-N-acetyl-D-glucosamine 2-epimerase
MVTSARSDWGVQRPVAAALRKRTGVQLSIIGCGMHLSHAFGHTVDQILADGFDVTHRLDFLQTGDAPESIATSIGHGVAAFAELFARHRPDIITVLGDRFDMFPAALAATPFLIPVAHMHGGEVTRGAFDDGLRHAMTKLSHIHLAAAEAYARRIRQLGEDPRNVYVVGAPGLDDLLTLQPVDDGVLRDEFGIRPGAVNLLVVYHAETRAYTDTPRDVAELLGALGELEANIVIVRPNADTANRTIQEALDGFCARHPRVRAPMNLPRRTFLSLMRASSALVGNSSSGIIEAPSFRLPVVNIGRRQEGRVQAANVINCEPARAAIRAAIDHALSPAFADTLPGLENPYGDGKSGERIADILATKPLTRELLYKPFADIP